MTDSAKESQIDRQYQSLADRNRRKILHLVWSRPIAAGEIAGHFEMSRPAVSRHLRVLCEADLLTVESQGTCRLYRANIKELQRLRDQFEAFWDVGLVRLKSVIEKKNRGRKREN